MAQTACVIGEGIQIKGNLSGSGDLMVRGRVEGNIQLEDHLTVEETGAVIANIATEGVTIHGTMNGDIQAKQSVMISTTATLVGDVYTPEFVMEEGARFRGRLEMEVPLPEGLLGRKQTPASSNR